MDLLLNVVVLALILGGSALITNWFARNMYNRCQKCGSLNAKRRRHCRVCNQDMAWQRTPVRNV